MQYLKSHFKFCIKTKDGACDPCMKYLEFAQRNVSRNKFHINRFWGDHKIKKSAFRYKL